MAGRSTFHSTQSKVTDDDTDRANDLISQARRALSDGNAAEAVSLATQAIEANPSNSR